MDPLLPREGRYQAPVAGDGQGWPGMANRGEHDWIGSARGVLMGARRPQLAVN